MRFIDNFIKKNTKNQEKKAMLHFYSQFISSGDLCFDVGANIGNRTEIFLILGATVVCIEPQESCYNTLLQRYGKNKKTTILHYGLAEEEGFLTLHICENAPTISTMSDEWIHEGRFSNTYKWTKSQLVPVTTLDNLINEYGVPKLCKIDVEGFEYPVLKGLHTQIPYISFEFTREFFDSAKNCINHLLSIGYTEFNCSIGESQKLFSSVWITHEELYTILDLNNDESLWGDFYARYNQ